jgi:hypothetical protein
LLTKALPRQILPATISNRLNSSTNQHSQNKDRISREEVLSFELTYIAIEQDHHLILDQLAPFNLPDLALLAVEEMTDNGGIIPHEAIE